MIKFAHVIVNNFRRRHCFRFIGGATALICITCLTFFLEPRFQTTVAKNAKQNLPEVELRMFSSRANSMMTSQPSTQRNASFSEIDESQWSSSVPLNKSRPSTEIQRQRTKPLGYGGTRCTSGPKRPPDVIEESFEWQRVAEGARNTFVFSAHYDPRGGRHVVTIVGISSDYLATSGSYLCHVWFSESPEAEVCEAEVFTHSETHGRSYAATFYICNFKSKEGIPYAVSLVRSVAHCQTATNLLKVSSYNRPSSAPEVNFTVCVTPLNYNYDDYRHLVESVELSRMFGAERFVYYNYSTGSSIDPYMRTYSDDGIVSVLPWNLPVVTDRRVVAKVAKVEPEIHYFGQLAALNDCLLRNMLRSRFVVFTDLDETVVPRKERTWMEMVEQLRRSHSGRADTSIASIHIQNAFFRIDYDRDPLFTGNERVRDLELNSLLTTVREAMIYPHGWRSKYIVDPGAVQFVGVHHIERMFDYSKASALNVDESVALLHHYRSWKESETERQKTVIDRYMHRFNATILARVMAVHRRVADRFKGLVTLP